MLRAVAVLVSVVTSWGCATQMSTKIESPYAAVRESDLQKKHSEEVLKVIDERNRTVESAFEWRRHSYEGFLIRSLGDVAESDYAEYAKYLDNGRVYVVVHPAYYTFFQGANPWFANRSMIDEPNAMEVFLNSPSSSAKERLIKAQEKMLRDFLEYMSTDRKLVLLVLPKDYREYPGYKYRQASDEYMRFINEVTNESPSVLYFYTKRPNRGNLTDKDRKTLMKFLQAIRAREILVGGGYIGRCLEDFYRDMDQFYENIIYVVPEITAISPIDISSGDASDMLHVDGTIDITALSARIRNNIFGNQAAMPNIKNLTNIESMSKN